jgi:hypothetical protein
VQPVAEQSNEEEIESVRIDPDLSAAGPGWGYVLIVAALLVAVVSVNRSDTPDQPAVDGQAFVGEQVSAESGRTASEDPAVATAGPVVPPAVAGGGPGLPERLGGVPSGPLRFDIQTQGECWIEAVVDGRRLVYRLMQPGERQTIESEREIVLRVGNPAALTYSINGAAGEPLGRPGVPVTVRFTNGGERATLAS